MILGCFHVFLGIFQVPGFRLRLVYGCFKLKMSRPQNRAQNNPLNRLFSLSLLYFWCPLQTLLFSTFLLLDDYTSEKMSKMIPRGNEEFHKRLVLVQNAVRSLRNKELKYNSIHVTNRTACLGERKWKLFMQKVRANCVILGSVFANANCKSYSSQILIWCPSLWYHSGWSELISSMINLSQHFCALNFSVSQIVPWDISPSD